jgi:hypothetical protein
LDYIAPEQAQNARTADIRADIYSLGCSLYYLLTGKPPFAGDEAAAKISARVLGDVPSVRKSRPEVSSGLERVLAKMTARDPANRYQTPGEVAKALEQHSGKERQARSRATTIADEPLPPMVERQSAWVVTSEATLPDEPIIRPSGAIKPAKRRGILMGALIAAAVCGLSCLGLTTLFFTASHDTPEIASQLDKGKTSTEMPRNKDNLEMAKNMNPAPKSKPTPPPQIEAGPGIEPDAKPDPEPEPKSELAPKPKAEADPKPELRPKQADDPKLTPKPKADPNPEPKPEMKPIPTTIHRSQTVGGKGGEPFEAKGQRGAFLIGFAVKMRGTEIAFLQPIYGTATGRKVAASGIGWPKDTQAHPKLEAKIGYAIGGLKVWCNPDGGFQLVIGIRILFMRRRGPVLDPKDSYWSEWIGASGKGQEVMLGGDGKPVIGIHGRAGGAIDSLGIIQLIHAPKNAPPIPKKDMAENQRGADAPERLPPLNSKVLEFAKNNLGKQVADGECAMLMLKAYEAAGARLPTPEEGLARVWGRKLKADEKPLPGDIVEFKDVKFEAKGGGDGFEALFHTTILLKVKDGKFVVLQQNGPGGRKVDELDLSAYEQKKGELILFRPVPVGTKLPKVDLPAPKGSWAEKPAKDEKVRYLSDMDEFDVKVPEGRFGKKGNLGFGAGLSFQIRVEEKESPHGLSMAPPSDAQSSVKYRVGKTARSFMAWAALNDSAGTPGRPAGEGKIPTPVTFQVLGDGKILWESKPVDIARKVQECKIDVAEVNVLELRVNCSGSGVNAHAVWLEPRVLQK